MTDILCTLNFVALAGLTAQLGGLQPVIPSLPDPPILEHYLLEAPWIFMAFLLVGGILGFSFLRKSGKELAGFASLGVGLVLAGLVFAIARFNTTTREALAEQGSRLIAAAATGDSATVDTLVAPNVSVTVMGSPYRTDKQQLLNFVTQDMLGRFKLREYSSSLRGAVIDGVNVARTQHKVRVVPELSGFPNGSVWVLHWRQSSSGQWQVVQIEAQHIEGVSAGMRF